MADATTRGALIRGVENFPNAFDGKTVALEQSGIYFDVDLPLESTYQCRLRDAVDLFEALSLAVAFALIASLVSCAPDALLPPNERRLSEEA